MRKSMETGLGSVAILRVLRGYEARFRQRLYQNLEKRLAQTGRAELTQRDIDECVGETYSELCAEAQEMPQPDMAVVTRSLADINEGRTRPIQEIIDAL